MYKKYYMILVCVLIFISISISSYYYYESKKINYTYDSHVSTVEKKADIIVRIDEIEYEPVQSTNKDGYIIMYVRYKNNSKYYIKDFALEIIGETVTSREKVETAINNNIGVKKGEKSDNYNLISTKDQRTKIPIKGEKGEYLKERFKYEIKSIRYSVLDNGKEYIYEYFLNDKSYKTYV